MSWFTQKHTSLPVLLGAAAAAVGLAVVLLQTIPSWREAPGHRPSPASASGWSRQDAAHDDHAEGNPSSTGPLSATDDGTAGQLLPGGIADAEGRGGSGMHRAVLKRGVWFPVFSPGEALRGGGPVLQSPVTEVPLSITSGSPPAGKTSVPFVFGFEAIGGTPPYRWRFQLAEPGAAFAMDTATGVFSGFSGVALSTVLEIFVTDSAGVQDSARYPLVIEEPAPLTVSTTFLATATVGTSYASRLTATGGAAPYLWAVTGLEGTGLSLTANTGELTGAPTTTGAHTLQVTVTDQEQTVAAATLTLTVTESTTDGTAAETEDGPGTPPRITTTALPEGTVDLAYAAQLTGEGGTAPLLWSLATSLPAGLSLDATTGIITGTPTVAGEFALKAVLTGQDGAQAVQDIALRIVNGLDITTASPLFPASPGLPYQIALTATGGQPPYRWMLKEGSLPVNAGAVPWTLSPDGILSGVAPPLEGVFRFTIEVQDNAGRAFAKAFDLPVRQGLLAIPSREKAGLAWQPAVMDAALRASGSGLAAVIVVRGVGTFPQTPAAGAPVYQGAGNNTVDRGLPTGGTFLYTLFAQTVDGRVLPYATAAATILPMTLQRAQPGVTGDPHADRVPAFLPLRAGGYGAASVPSNITGPPDGKGTLVPASLATEVASLHAKTGAGGATILEFTDNIVELGPGADFSVFENVFFVGGDANNRFMEPAVVWVALFEGEWFRFPIDVVPPAAGQTLKLNDPFYYNRGFAGRNPTTGSNPTNPNVSGGDAFDADELAIPGLTWIRYIKIQSTGDNTWVDDFGGDPVRHPSGNGALSGGGTSGFDLDAVSAVNY